MSKRHAACRPPPPHPSPLPKGEREPVLRQSCALSKTKFPSIRPAASHVPVKQLRPPPRPSGERGNDVQPNAKRTGQKEPDLRQSMRTGHGEMLPSDLQAQPRPPVKQLRPPPRPSGERGNDIQPNAKRTGQKEPDLRQSMRTGHGEMLLPSDLQPSHAPVKQLRPPPRPSGERAGVRGCCIQPGINRASSLQPVRAVPVYLSQLGPPPRPSGERAGVRGSGIQPNSDHSPGTNHPR